MDPDAGHGAALGRCASPDARRAPSGRPALSPAAALAAEPGRATTDDPVADADPHAPAIHPSADATSLRRSYAIAEHMHRGQMRKSGEPYITHPLAVAQILAELGMDTTTLVAALLHDTVEDTELHAGGAARRLRPRGGAAGRRRDQVRQGVLRRRRRGRDASAR